MLLVIIAYCIEFFIVGCIQYIKPCKQYAYIYSTSINTTVSVIRHFFSTNHWASVTLGGALWSVNSLVSSSGLLSTVICQIPGFNRLSLSVWMCVSVCCKSKPVVSAIIDSGVVCWSLKFFTLTEQRIGDKCIEMLWKRQDICIYCLKWIWHSC